MSGAKRADKVKGSATGWRNPLVKIGTVKPLMGETTPLVFNGRLYRLENWQKFMDLPNATVADQFMDDQVRVWDVGADELVSVVCEGHSFGTAFVWQDRVYVFAGRHPAGQPWRTVKQITLTTSDDLRTWSDPEVVIEAGPDEHLLQRRRSADRGRPATRGVRRPSRGTLRGLLRRA
jgi:alpha-L-fucosidase